MIIVLIRVINKLAEKYKFGRGIQRVEFLSPKLALTLGTIELFEATKLRVRDGKLVTKKGFWDY